MHPYIGAHLHHQSPSSHQNPNIFRFSPDQSRWTWQVYKEKESQKYLAASMAVNKTSILIQIFCSQLRVTQTH